MSEEHDEAELRALFAAAGDRPPMADNAFVRRVMTDVEAEVATRRANFNMVVWAAAAAAGFVAVTQSSRIVAELSRTLAAVGADVPTMGAGMTTLLLISVAAGGAWLFSERG